MNVVLFAGVDGLPDEGQPGDVGLTDAQNLGGLLIKLCFVGADVQTEIGNLEHSDPSFANQSTTEPLMTMRNFREKNSAAFRQRSMRERKISK